jgi:hypothetical protein
MPVLRLPTPDGRLQSYTTRLPRVWSRQRESFDRVALSAVHVVSDPLTNTDPWTTPSIDWDATIRYRQYIWSLGLGVAEAMDTAQRGMGLGWNEALQLISRSIDAARDVKGAVLFSGAGTDHIAPGASVTLDDVIRGYEDQISAIEALGGRIILMASRALKVAARSPDDYARVYDRILRQVREPLIVHWLGEMFDPQLEGYWGFADHGAAMDVSLAIIADHAGKVDGIKVSLLDKDKEIAMRRRLPPGVRMYTGDDFNYPELIAGDAHGYSDALLGIFDAIAPAAASALAAHRCGDVAAYHDILAPTVPLARHIFKSPTQFYKTGVVFMAWLNAHQANFTMVGGQQSARSILHLAEIFRLADAAGLLNDPDVATVRMKSLLSIHGVDA